MKTIYLSLYCLWLATSSHLALAQPTYENLVFEGAGIKGLAYAGVLQVLEEKQLLQPIQRVAGTSAGAITALLVSIGYSSAEINAIISSTKFQKFNEGGGLVFGGAWRMKNRFGWYKTETFAAWLGDLIEAKTGQPDLTFLQLQQLGYKKLFVLGTCLNQQKLLTFSVHTYPNMKVKDAVRVSMSVPFYFVPGFIDKEGRLYKRQNKDESLDVVVDGGILGNFPIWLFDEYFMVDEGYPPRIPNPKTLGIRMDSDHQIANDAKSRGLVTMPIHSLKMYVEAFYVLVLENLNRQPLLPGDWTRTLSVSSKDIGPKIKKLSKEQKQTLLDSGVEATKAFFK